MAAGHADNNDGRDNEDDDDNDEFDGSRDNDGSGDDGSDYHGVSRQASIVNHRHRQWSSRQSSIMNHEAVSLSPPS